MWDRDLWDEKTLTSGPSSRPQLFRVPRWDEILTLIVESPKASSSRCVSGTTNESR